MVEAEVAHRAVDETFAVITRDLRVEVRGTRFSVGTASGGSWVRVDEGRVDVGTADGHHRLVSTGETLTWPPSPPPPVEEVGPSATTTRSTALGAHRVVAPGAGDLTPSCAEAQRGCEATARAVRESMRAGDPQRALRLLATFARDRRDARAGRSCGPGSVTACADELGYLRAEALRAAGRIDAAIEAYRSLGRRAEPAAMRQNAFYAAAELEARRGRATRARADYERALVAAPHGALGAESLLGAMDGAAGAGDGARAVSLARRYLDQFPAGLGVARARRISQGISGSEGP